LDTSLNQIIIKYAFRSVHFNYTIALWLLSRNPKIKEDIKDFLIKKAAALGFDTSKLIFVDHH